MGSYEMFDHKIINFSVILKSLLTINCRESIGPDRILFRHVNCTESIVESNVLLTIVFHNINYFTNMKAWMILNYCDNCILSSIAT